MKATTVQARKLQGEVSLLQIIIKWSKSNNSFCSALMGERVTNIQVARMFACFVFISLAIFTVQSSFIVTILFAVLAAFCSRDIEKGNKS